MALLLKGGFTFMSGGQVVRFRGFDNAWDLECAVQDTFIHAFAPAARQAYDGIKPFGPYLLTIAKNRVISQLRSDQREARRRTRLKAEGLTSAPQTPEARAMEEELRALVAEFRATLTPEERELLDLRYLQDRNLLETARLLGISRMRARTRDRKLRERLTEFLRERGLIDDRGDGPPPGLLPVLLQLGGPR